MIALLISFAIMLAVLLAVLVWTMLSLAITSEQRVEDEMDGYPGVPHVTAKERED